MGSLRLRISPPRTTCKYRPARRSQGPCGGIGRRDGFKIRFLRKCQFESGQGHHFFFSVPAPLDPSQAPLSQLGSMLTLNALKAGVFETGPSARITFYLTAIRFANASDGAAHGRWRAVALAAQRGRVLISRQLAALTPPMGRADRPARRRACGHTSQGCDGTAAPPVHIVINLLKSGLVSRTGRC